VAEVRVSGAAERSALLLVGPQVSKVVLLWSAKLDRLRPWQPISGRRRWHYRLNRSRSANLERLVGKRALSALRVAKPARPQTLRPSRDAEPLEHASCTLWIPAHDKRTVALDSNKDIVQHRILQTRRRCLHEPGDTPRSRGTPRTPTICRCVTPAEVPRLHVAKNGD